MPEIYVDWKLLKPLEGPAPVGTKCVVIKHQVDDKFGLGEVVTVTELSYAPVCVNTDGVHDVFAFYRLARLHADYKENTFVLTRVNKSDSKVCALCGARLFTGDEAVVELDAYNAKSLICTKCADADEELCHVVIDERKNFELED